MSDPTPAVSPHAVIEKQAELFDAKLFPLRPDLVENVKKKSFVHNASILSKDDELCRDVCLDLLVGISGRLIAKKYHISRNSVLKIEKVMIERGELEPLKKQAGGFLEEITHLGLERWRDALAADEIPPAQIPIGMGIAIDKKEQLAAGIIPGTERTVREVTTADVEAAWLAMKRLPSDAGSAGAGAKGQQIEGKPAPDTALDTRPHGSQEPERGAGGSGPAEGGAEAEGSAGEKIGT